jgi:lipoate-protein ligase A
MSEAEVCGTFQILRRSGSCSELCEQLPNLTARTIVLAKPNDRAVIVGSAQEPTEQMEFRCEEAGFAIVRRRSGGGAVVIVPDEVVWVDLFLPADDPLFESDVRSGSQWVGDLWSEVVQQLAGTDRKVAVHRDALVEAPWSRACCFLGLGPGEVTLGGQKIMGLSQRRSRAGAWFFSLVYRTLEIERDAALLTERSSDAKEVADKLAQGVTVLPFARGEIIDVLLGIATDIA